MPDAPVPTKLRRRLWVWFLVGFTTVFAGLLFFLPTQFYDGHSVRATVLGHYYLLEIQMELNNQGILGPTSDNWAAALSTAAQHVLVSAVAGAILMGIGWASQKRMPSE